MKRPERLRKCLAIFTATMRADNDSIKAFDNVDSWLMTQGLSYTSRHDYLQSVEKMYTTLSVQEQNKQDSDKSTQNILIESSTPASLDEAIKTAHNESKGKD